MINDKYWGFGMINAICIMIKRFEKQKLELNRVWRPESKAFILGDNSRTLQRERLLSSPSKHSANEKP